METSNDAGHKTYHVEERGKRMLNSKGESELDAVIQEKEHIEKQIRLSKLLLAGKHLYLVTEEPMTPEYQQVLEDWQALQGYIAELSAQSISLDETLRDLSKSRRREGEPG
jgi:chaperonin cofactor prefoldin